MKLKECRDIYEEMAAVASSINRHLGLAGVGAVWVLKISALLNRWLLVILLLFCVSLFLDILQYFLHTCLYRYYFNKYDKDGVELDSVEVSVSPRVNALLWRLWGAKMVFMLAGYIILFVYFAVLFAP